MDLTGAIEESCGHERHAQFICYHVNAFFYSFYINKLDYTRAVVRFFVLFHMLFHRRLEMAINTFFGLGDI